MEFYSIKSFSVVRRSQSLFLLLFLLNVMSDEAGRSRCKQPREFGLRHPTFRSRLMGLEPSPGPQRCTAPAECQRAPGKVSRNLTGRDAGIFALHVRSVLSSVFAPRVPRQVATLGAKPNLAGSHAAPVKLAVCKNKWRKAERFGATLRLKLCRFPPMDGGAAVNHFDLGASNRQPSRLPTGQKPPPPPPPFISFSHVEVGTLQAIVSSD